MMVSTANRTVTSYMTFGIFFSARSLSTILNLIGMPIALDPFLRAVRGITRLATWQIYFKAHDLAYSGLVVKTLGSYIEDAQSARKTAHRSVKYFSDLRAGRVGIASRHLTVAQWLTVTVWLEDLVPNVLPHCQRRTAADNTFGQCRSLTKATRLPMLRFNQLDCSHRNPQRCLCPLLAGTEISRIESPQNRRHIRPVN
jgi:hypothetical protein